MKGIKIKKIFFVSLSIIIFMSGNLFATIMYLPSLDELIEGSDLILVGKVISINKFYPINIAEIGVDKVIKGSVKENRALVKYQIWVEDQPDFKKEEKVLLFLKQSGGYYITLYKEPISDNNTVFDSFESKEEKSLEEFVEQIKNRLKQ